VKSSRPGPRRFRVERTSSVKIRNLKLEDLSDIITFSKKAYGYEKEEHHLDDLRDLTNSATEGFAREPQGMFVAEIDGRIVGTLFASYRGEPPGEARLAWIGIDPDYQGRGIGKKLMAKAEAYLRSKGVKRVLLGTDRPRAMPFYLSTGYGVVNCTMMKHLRQTGPRTRAQRVTQAIEEYTAFCFTHHNADHLTEAVKTVLSRKMPRAKKIDALIEIAAPYVIYPMTTKRADAFREKLGSILRKN